MTENRSEGLVQADASGPALSEKFISADDRLLDDRTALSWWFPRIFAAGLPVPKTILLDIPRDAEEAAWGAFDGKEAGSTAAFFQTINEAASSIGYPAFLRTDHTSGKHSWKDACFLASKADIGRCVFGIIEFSECCDIFGLPWSRWAVREFLPTMPVGICPNFGNMPICREFRFFVEDGKVRCWHPYWPLHALEQGGAVFHGDFDFDEFCSPDDLALLTDLAERAGEVCGGAWSVDILETERGWYVTDMAEAHKSFHWEGCVNDFKASPPDAELNISNEPERDPVSLNQPLTSESIRSLTKAGKGE